MSGLSGHQEALDLFLQEHGIATVLFSGGKLLSGLNPLRKLYRLNGTS